MARKFEINDDGDVTLRLDGKHTLIIHAADEGVVLDVWPDDDSDGSIWSTYHFYNEMLPEEDDEDAST
jgi:hypothetical protein